MFFGGYGGGRCPAGVTHSAQGSNFVLFHWTSGMMSPNNSPQWAGADTKDARSMFFRIIARGECNGLPVTMLRAVGQAYRLKVIAADGTAAFDRRFKMLKLKESTYFQLLDMNTDKPYSRPRAPNPLYHESTHAYLKLRNNDTTFKAFLAKKQNYSKDAPIEDGKRSKNRVRLWTERRPMLLGVLQRDGRACNAWPS